MLTAVMAWGHSSRGTGSMTEEFHAGVSTAVQQPHTNTRNSTDAGPPQRRQERRARQLHHEPRSGHGLHAAAHKKDTTADPQASESGLAQGAPQRGRG